MKRCDLVKLVKKHNGWMEGDVARFPSPHNKEQFLRELNSIIKVNLS